MMVLVFDHGDDLCATAVPEPPVPERAPLACVACPDAGIKLGPPVGARIGVVWVLPGSLRFRRASLAVGESRSSVILIPHCAARMMRSE